MTYVRLLMMIGAFLILGSEIASAEGRPPTNAVPIPGSDLLFGLGLAAMAWLGPKIARK